MSGWISSENVFVAPTRKGDTLPKLADLLKTELFVVLEEGESFSTRVFSPCGTKVRNCAAMLSQIREKLNPPTEWTIQFNSLQSTSSWFGSVNHYPWEFKHPAKNANELGPAWQNLAGKSHIHGHKENGLELFKSKRHFGEIKQPKTLNQPQWRTLHF